MPAQSAICVLPDAIVPAVVCLGDLLPHLGGLGIDRVTSGPGGVVIEARCGAAGAACPGCGGLSSRLHSGYTRTVADGPLGGRPVCIRLAVRRFFCGNRACGRVTFAEQAAGLTGRYLRRSLPLRELLAQVALALAGRAGARLAAAAGAPVHRSTLLRLVAALPEPVISAAPEILGVDDFALRKGHVYGTVLVDISTGKAIDLLPDRDAGTVTAWLGSHPGARVICRDRAGAYAQDGAPDAIQVADRRHLWHNLAEHAEKTVAAHRSCLKEEAPEPAAATAPQAGHEELRDGCGRPRPLVTRTRDRHAAICDLLAAGHSAAAAGRALGLSEPTVTRYARAPDVTTLLATIPRPAQLDPFKPYLHQRWNEGITDARQLHAELKARGFTGSDQTVRRYVRPFRTQPAALPAPTVPKTRQITRWLLTRPASLSPADREALAGIRARCPHIDNLATHLASFAEMMTHRTGDQDLPGWLAAAEAADQPHLHTFTAGLRRDLPAVTAGLTLPYSSGKVEGNVNRIKMIKRQMYGRASFALLRKRVIHHPP